MAMQLLPYEFAVNVQMKQFYREQKYHALELHESYRSYQSIKIFFMSLHMQPAWVRHVTLMNYDTTKKGKYRTHKSQLQAVRLVA